jgi:hypothetical protein
VSPYAALVLSGHDHALQRFRPRDETVQLVVGACGRGRYRIDESDRRLAFGSDWVHGALRMRLRPGAARLAFVAADDTFLDRATVPCRAASA